MRIGKGSISIDGQKDDGLVRILAEPNIMAISGQQASFLSGGKIFIPVAQTNTNGVPVMTLEEKEFGIGVKFTPTVLGNSRVNLKLVSEVSDLSQTGSPFTAINGVTSVIPRSRCGARTPRCSSMTGKAWSLPASSRTTSPRPSNAFRDWGKYRFSARWPAAPSSRPIRPS
jgi:Flp pilus assembly secretin CpaC